MNNIIKEYNDNGYIFIKKNFFKNIKKLIKKKILFYSNYILLKNNIINNKINSFDRLSDRLIFYDKKCNIISNLYDILPADPDIFNLVNNTNFIKITKDLSIKNPLVGTIPTIRFDRPMDAKRNTPKHRDFWYSFLSKNSITIWFNLEDDKKELGNLIVYPKSQKIIKDGIQDSKKGTYEYKNKDIKLEEKIEINLKKDEILIFNQNLIHQSGINKSTKARISVQIRYNDLNSLKEFKSSFKCTISDYVSNKQRELLNDK